MKKFKYNLNIYYSRIPSSFREKAKDLRETKAFVDVCEFYKQ